MKTTDNDLKSFVEKISKKKKEGHAKMPVTSSKVVNPKIRRFGGGTRSGGR